MRVLYAADPFLPVPPTQYGGIERVVASLARQALEAGHEVALLAHPESFIPGVTIYPLAVGRSGANSDLSRNIFRVRAAAREFQPDILHSFARLATLLAVLPASLPKIMSFQRDPTPRTVRGAGYLASGSLLFAGCSQAISARGRLGGGRWETVPNGIDLELYPFRAETPPDAPLVFLSRIERVKGAHRAIAAARASGRSLILAGNRSSCGPEADYWDQEIAPHLGRDGISYVGPLDDRGKSDLLGGAAALLVPIEWEEPFGLVFAEALACGTPVISSPRGALPEIITSGREGFLCRDEDELVAAIGRLPEINRAACRQKAESCFSSTLMYRRYESIYRRLAVPVSRIEPAALAR
jgi:glycosyltransferase involved in cell wall biosynthesis